MLDYMCIQVYISFCMHINTNVLYMCSFTMVKFVMSLNFVDGFGKKKFF